MALYLCIDCGLHLCIEGVQMRRLEWPQSGHSEDVLCRLQMLKPELLSDH